MHRLSGISTRIHVPQFDNNLFVRSFFARHYSDLELHVRSRVSGRLWSQKLVAGQRRHGYGSLAVCTEQLGAEKGKLFHAS